MQTHSPAFVLPYGRQTRAHWALRPPRCLLVFVHGFLGRGTTTWAQLPGMLADSAPGRAADLVLFDYSCVRRRVQSVANVLGSLLRSLITPRSRELVPPSIAAIRGGVTPYERVVLVCHSMGAVVARRALLDLELAAAGGAGADLTACRVALFAPAHTGADAEQLVRSSTFAFGIPAGVLAFTTWPCLYDLAMGSEVLAQLRTDAEEVDRRIGRAFAAEVVIWAEHEVVVSPVRFYRDPVPRSAPGETHVSVCKATPTRTLSRDVLAGILE